MLLLRGEGLARAFLKMPPALRGVLRGGARGVSQHIHGAAVSDAVREPGGRSVLHSTEQQDVRCQHDRRLLLQDRAPARYERCV